MMIGYARISTGDQTLASQLHALTEAGCVKIFQEQVSGAQAARTQLTAALDFCRDHAGDVLVVYKLDRLGRSLKDLLALVAGLHQRGIGFQVLTGLPIDTSTPHGVLMFQLFGALAEYERALIRERVQAGLTAARARGRLGGNKFKLSEDQCRMALAQYTEGTMSAKEIGKALRVSEWTIYRAVRRAKGQAVPKTPEVAD